MLPLSLTKDLGYVYSVVSKYTSHISIGNYFLLLFLNILHNISELTNYVVFNKLMSNSSSNIVLLILILFIFYSEVSCKKLAYVDDIFCVYSS